MEHIDFRTAHNIVITYPLAGLWKRVFATALDTFFLYLFIVALAIGFQGTSMFVLLSSIIYFMYHIIFEIFNKGQSLGKMALKIKVVTLNGHAPNLKQYFIRWVFRFVDGVLTLGTLGMFSIYSSTYGQRIGDLLAGTTVVSLVDDRIYSLPDLEKLSTLKRTVRNYNLNKYTDEDMIVVKTLITRYKAYSTEENYDLIVELAQKIKQDTGDTTTIGDYITYLEDVLNEYVLLTR
jgi:uncharacterized RDD family membrane protein YckC